MSAVEENNVANCNNLIINMPKFAPFEPSAQPHQLTPAPPYDCGGATSIVTGLPYDCGGAAAATTVSGHKRQRHRVAVKQEVAVNVASARVSEDEQYNDRINEADVEFFNSFPPGYRFCPTDEELIEHYLLKKLKNVQLPKNQIREVNIYRFNPDQIAERYPSINKNAWYFFTPRDKKYLHGKRPNRAAGAGFWKACGADRIIYDKNRPVKIGLKKALVYHRGKPPKGQKTNWLMHEFMLHEHHPQFSEIKTDIDRPADSMKLNDFVLCKIYKRNDNAMKAEKAEAIEEEEGKPQAAVMVGDQGNHVIADTEVKEEFYDGNVKVEEDDHNNNAGFHHLQNNQPFNPAIPYPFHEYYPYNNQMPPSTTSYHENQNQNHDQQHYGFQNSHQFLMAFDPSMNVEDMADYLVEGEFDDIISP